VDGPHPLVQLTTIAATLEHGLVPPWPCPPRARSTGIWRSLTVNSGRLHTDLTCAIGVGSRPSRVPGRAFQARDAGSIPVTRSPILPGRPPAGIRSAGFAGEDHFGIAGPVPEDALGGP
jgi:hypothetical protein